VPNKGRATNATANDKRFFASMNATDAAPRSDIENAASDTDIAGLLSTVSQKLQLITEFQVEMAKSLQVLHQEQQRFAALIAGTAQVEPVAAAVHPSSPTDPLATLLPTPPASGHKPVEFICVGLDEADPYFQMLRQNAVQAVNLRCAGIQDALTITKGRPAGAETIIQLFNVAAMVQNGPDMQRTVAICDSLFHSVRMADQLGAKVTWTVNDLPRHDRPHSQIAHEFYRHMAGAPLIGGSRRRF